MPEGKTSRCGWEVLTSGRRRDETGHRFEEYFGRMLIYFQGSRPKRNAFVAEPDVWWSGGGGRRPPGRTGQELVKTGLHTH